MVPTLGPGGKLGDEMPRRVVNQPVCRIEPKAVEVVLVKPMQRVLDEEFAHVLGALVVEVNGGSPRTAMLPREVQRAEKRPGGTIRTKVVIDDVQQDREVETMGRIHEPTEIGGPYVCEGAKRLTPSYPQLRDPGKSATGINSTIVMPRSARYGSRSATAANVPASVNVPTWSSYRTACSSGNPVTCRQTT